MSTWLHYLPVWQMASVIFGATFLMGAAVHIVTGWLSAGRYRRSFLAISPALLSPIGIVFGLLIAFTAAQVWNDTERANIAVATEAGALRSIIVLSAVLPDEAQTQLQMLVREYIEQTITTEWALMAQGSMTLQSSPPSLNKALQFTLSLTVSTPGQQTAQREVASFVERALEARRARILVSRTEISGVKWVCLILLAVCLMFTIASVHCENRLSSAISIGIFSIALATTLLLILAHDRPFAGEIAVRPDPLLQVMPKGSQ